MKYKVSPQAPAILYEFVDDRNALLQHKYIQFTPDGKFFLHGKASKDLSALGKVLIDWIMFYSEMNGFVKKDEIKCDCGAEKSNTTHSSWCSTNQP